MIPYVDTGTYLFRFMDHRTSHFWPAIADMLSEQKLFLNSRIKFNDPFDSQPTVKDDLSSSAIRNYLEDMMRNPYNPKRDPSTIAKILNLKFSGKTHLNKKQIENIKAGARRNASKYLDTCGLLSFSLTAENPLLWGHYAAAFEGVCAVFRRSTSTRSALSICAKVLYVEKRPQLPLNLLFKLATSRMAGDPIDELVNQIFFLSFLHKSKHWAYEEEARVFYPFCAFKKIDFEPNELVAIILGPRSQSELEKKLVHEIKARRPAVALHKALLSQSEYKIIIPHNFLRSTRIAA